MIKQLSIENEGRLAVCHAACHVDDEVIYRRARAIYSRDVVMFHLVRGFFSSRDSLYKEENIKVYRLVFECWKMNFTRSLKSFWWNSQCTRSRQSSTRDISLPIRGTTSSASSAFSGIIRFIFSNLEGSECRCSTILRSVFPYTQENIRASPSFWTRWQFKILLTFQLAVLFECLDM